MKEFYFGESKPPFFPPPKVYTTPEDLLKAVAEALGGYVEEWHTGRWCLIAPKEQPAPQEENIQCPVCGYYCLGKGGHGCINKPSIVKQQQEEDEWEEFAFHKLQPEFGADKANVLVDVIKRMPKGGRP